MPGLTGKQKKYLKGIAHHLKPTVQIGQQGISDTVQEAVLESLRAHELIKIKFVDLKEREHKDELTRAIVEFSKGELVGTIGHVVILYRPHPAPDKRKILLPDPEASR